MGLDAAGPTIVTNRPAPDARPSPLHRRLTVALASASDRARLTEVIIGDPGCVGMVDAPTRLGAEELWEAADGLAQERAADRKELRARLDGVAARIMHD